MFINEICLLQFVVINLNIHNSSIIHKTYKVNVFIVLDANPKPQANTVALDHQHRLAAPTSAIRYSQEIAQNDEQGRGGESSNDRLDL